MKIDILRLSKTRNNNKTIKVFIILTFFSIFCQTTSIGQSKKLTKEERKQEQKNIDSLFIVNSLPVSIALRTGFSDSKLKDSITQIFIANNFRCLNEEESSSMIKENMFSFMPSVLTQKERYLEVMEKVMNDKTYYDRLMAEADPFMQGVYISMEKTDTGIATVNVKRQNFPNVKKNRVWTFNYNESESIDALAIRIAATLTNTNKTQ